MTTDPDSEEAAKQLERVRRYQDILNDFGRIASETKQLDQLLHAACVQAARGIGIKQIKVMRYRPAEGDLLIVAGFGWKPWVVGKTALDNDVAFPSERGSGYF